MSRRVLILGAGAAGLSAAFAARNSGADVVLVSAGAGASSLGGGAVDDVPWEERMHAARVLGSPIELHALPAEVAAFSNALGIWDLPDRAPPPFVATIAGRLRPSRGRDKGLLDLGALHGKRVLLPRAPRAGWDADAIAATLSDDPLARRTGLRFVAIDAPVLRFADEARISDGDLAARHDDPARIAWLGERLREAITTDARVHPDEPASAVLLGSWLGARAARAAELSERIGLPVGEALVGVGSAAGLRFDAAQKKFLDALGVQRIGDRAVSLVRDGDRLLLTRARDTAKIAADAAVIAMGGVAGGGIVYDPPEHDAGEDLPARGAIPFALSIDAPVALALGRGPLDVVASMHGPELDQIAWPKDAAPSALEAVGVHAPGGRAAPGIFVAGDVLAARPRTLLEAVASGLRAGRAAAQPA
ncbi:FAD-binding protein [Polyangium sp. 15x6]|uniref:FAD-binding protein n=1 Tax=Polyangium sp. 15x6 TaxID=3042687 RepID=UPI00249B1CEA|nr:FAD-binding protein [Polyangium sp. 15x6]MDI3284923.1 FAD-binding protein [Polyangium sp. 15x6]